MDHSLRIAGTGTNAGRRGSTTMRSGLTYVALVSGDAVSDNPVPCSASM